MIAQRVVTERLLPVPRLGEDLAALVPMAVEPGVQPRSRRRRPHRRGLAVDYLYEPDAQRIFDALLPRLRAVRDLPRAARVGGRASTRRA